MGTGAACFCADGNDPVRWGWEENCLCRREEGSLEWQQRGATVIWRKAVGRNQVGKFIRCWNLGVVGSSSDSFP